MIVGVACPGASADPACVLANPSFESPEGPAGHFDGWNRFGDVEAALGVGGHGAAAAIVRGPNAGAWQLSGVWQALAGGAGETWRVRLLAGAAPGEPMVGQTRGIVNVEWRDAADELISYESHDVVVAGAPAGVLTPIDFTTDAAPAGTASVRLLLATLQGPDQAPGAAAFDAVRFERAQESGDDAFQFGDCVGGREVEFGGRSWRVKGPGVFGPGPCTFSDAPDHVWADADGLHLTIADDGGWSSTEVVLEPYLGYGDYRFTVEGRPDLWAENVVLGLFLWETRRGCAQELGGWWNPYNEFDIELSRWGDPGAEVAQFVAQPWDYPGNLDRYGLTTTPTGTTTTIAFRWLADRVDCRTWRGGLGDEAAGGLLHAWTYAGPHVPRAERPHVRMNLWQLNGAPPANGQDHEAVIRAFAFAPACPGDVDRNGVLNLDDVNLFAVAFVEGSADADVDGNGVRNLDDINVFAASFVEGCE